MNDQSKAIAANKLYQAARDALQGLAANARILTEGADASVLLNLPATDAADLEDVIHALGASHLKLAPHVARQEETDLATLLAAKELLEICWA
jgi:hypothetical protein